MQRPSRTLIVVFWLVAIGLYLAPRLSSLDADPPNQVYSGWLSAELLVEPPAKAHEARNWALFGTWKTNEVDNYQFWRAQAPAWVYPLALSFKWFGVSYATLRTTATLFGLAGLVGIVLWAHRRFGSMGAIVGAVLFATDQFAIHFGRSGILEPMVAGYCALGLCFLDRAFERVAWLAPAFALLVLGLATKLAALPAVPVFLLFGALAAFRSEGATRKRLVRGLAVVIGLAVVGALVAYALSPAYMRTLEWNFHHMLLAREGGTEIDLDALDDEQIGADVAEVLKRMQRLRWMFPVAVVCAGLEIARQAYLVARRRASVSGLLPLVYFLSFAFGVFVPKFSGLRFLVLLHLPLLFLALSFVFAVVNWLAALQIRPARFVARFGPVVFALGCAGWGLGTWAYARARLTHDLRDASALLNAQIGDRPDAVVIGLWAAPVVLETPYKHYYVKSVFNSTPEALAQLMPTHTVLLEADYTRAILEEKWPDAITLAKPLGTFRLREKPLTLSEVSLVARNRLRRDLGLPLIFPRR